MHPNRAVTLIALASLSTALAFPGASKAVIVTVEGQQYDVTTFSGSYDNNASLFNTASAGGAMPWWNDWGLANQFVLAVEYSLGNANSGYGPIFSTYAYRDPDFPEFDGIDGVAWLGGGTVGYFTTSPIPFSESRTYARASLVPPPATATPGPLPILGAASAFGMSRRLRRGITSQAFKF
jgi:hypothetical protein